MDLLLTRPACLPSGAPRVRDGRQLLEFLVVQRTDSAAWGLPGTMLRNTGKDGDTVLAQLAKRVSERAFFQGPDRKAVTAELSTLLKNHGRQIANGVCLYFVLR